MNFPLMKLPLKHLALHLVFLVLIVTWLQVTLLIFPPDHGHVYGFLRLLGIFQLGCVALIHNLAFNYYIRRKRKFPVYLLITVSLVMAGWSVLTLLFPPRPETGIAASVTAYAGIVVFFILAGFVFDFIFQKLTSKNNYLENQVIMKQLELDHLKNQLNPHFLFNSLNNVAATMQVDSELALNYIYTLSSLLRYQVESSGKDFVTLAEENFFLESFLGIEELRLGDRCGLSFDSELTNPGEKIPPMLLQPFVERAIKQSSCVSSRAEITISLLEKDHELFLSTRGTIPGNATQSHFSDIGIENARKRLELFYPSSHRIVSGLVEGFIETTLYIDLKRIKRIT